MADIKKKVLIYLQSSIFFFSFFNVTACFCLNKKEFYYEWKFVWNNECGKLPFFWYVRIVYCICYFFVFLDTPFLIRNLWHKLYIFNFYCVCLFIRSHSLAVLHPHSCFPVFYGIWMNAIIIMQTKLKQLKFFNNNKNQLALSLYIHLTNVPHWQDGGVQYLWSMNLMATERQY